MGTLFSASRGAHLLFTSDWARLLNFIMLLWEGRGSSAQRACYLPSLSRYPFIHLGREEQARVKCLAQGHNTRAFTGFEPTTLGSWVRNSTAELRVPLYFEITRCFYWFLFYSGWWFCHRSWWRAWWRMDAGESGTKQVWHYQI